MIKKKNKLKAGQLLEFTLLIPMVVLLMTFSVDMGRLVVANTSLRDAAAISARAGARVGYAGIVPNPSDCSNDSSSSISYHAFCQDATLLMGARIKSYEVITPRYGAENYCVYNGGVNSSTNMYITVKARAEMTFLTPGLAVAFRLSNSAMNSSTNLEAVGVARCEVSR